MKSLTKKDAKQYLKSGTLTQPFLADDFVLQKVMTDYNYKISKGQQITKIESLMFWIRHNVKIGKDDNFIDQHKFNRTAQEIWESKVVTGCTDRVLLFCTFARQIGIPTTFLHTVEFDWLKDFKSGKKQLIHKGHTFCECYYEGEWVLVDPTCLKIVKNYNASKIILPYDDLEYNVFIPYFRGLDLKEKMTLQQHNQQEETMAEQLDA